MIVVILVLCPDSIDGLVSLSEGNFTYDKSFFGFLCIQGVVVRLAPSKEVRSFSRGLVLLVKCNGLSIDSCIFDFSGASLASIRIIDQVVCGFVIVRGLVSVGILCVYGVDGLILVFHYEALLKLLLLGLTCHECIL